MLSELKSLIFDLDGTLYVNRELERDIWRAGCRYVSQLKDITDAAAAELIRETRKRLSVENGMESTLSHACIEIGGDLRELHQRFAAEVNPERILSPDKRVLNLLLSLGQRFDLFIYTNNNSTLADRIIESIGLFGLFRRIFTIEDYWVPKPDRTALENIYRAIGRRAAECMFIGDRYDVDLRLPAVMGSTVFFSKKVEDLFPLSKLLYEEEL